MKKNEIKKNKVTHAVPVDFEHLFDSAPGLFLVLDRDLMIVGVSDEYLKATMTERHAIIGRPLFEVFPDNPNDLNANGVSRLKASLDFVIRNKKAHTMDIQKYDIRDQHGNFEERYWSPHNKPVLDMNKEVVYIIHRAEDVTEQVKLEKKGEQHEITLRELENKRAFIKDNEERTNRILDVLLKYTLLDFSEKAAISPTGDELDAIAVGLNTLGEELQDHIRQLRESEERTRASEQRFRLLVEGVRDYAIFMLDEKGYIVSWNEGAKKIKGYAADEIIGKHMSVFYTPEEIERDVPANNLRMAMENGEYRCEGFRKRKDGTLFIADVLLSSIYGPDGRLQGFAKITRDVTQQRTAAKQIEKLNHELSQNIDQLKTVNKELEAFSYSVSHDLRAPLRAVNGYAQMMNEDYGSRLDPEAKRILNAIQRNAVKMGSLIDDLLSFSRLGRKEVQRSEVDMNELTEGVLIDIGKTTVHKADIRIEKLHSIKADYGLIHQVVYNLVSNAIKYSSKTEQPVISISSEEKDGEVIFSIRDNGAGFNMNYYNKLFGVFQRLHTQDEFEGTGVGLAIVQRIVTKHGGKVWAESKVNEGAAFYFSIPNPTI